MKHTLLFILLVASPMKIFSQKLNGIYFGEIVSKKNALVIHDSSGFAIGFLYLNKSDRLNFSGTYNNGFLKGSIRLPNSSEFLLEGQLEKNLLKLIFSDNNGKKNKGLLFKVSSKAKLNVDYLFSEQYNPMLLGRWESIKHFERDGTESSDGKTAYEFESNGRGYSQLVALPKDFAPKSDGPPGFNPYKKLEMNWSTKEKELTVSLQFHERESTGNFDYLIRGDTIITNTNGYVTFYKRK